MPKPSSFEQAGRLAVAARQLHHAIGHLQRSSGPDPGADIICAEADQELAGVTIALRRPHAAEHALRHVERLEAMLSLSLGRAAERCRVAADELARLEEQSVAPLGSDAAIVRSAAELARRLRRAAYDRTR